MFVVSVIIGINEQKFLCDVSNQKNKIDIGQKPYWIFCFCLFWIINTEKASLLFMSSVKKRVLENGCLWSSQQLINAIAANMD